MSQDDITIRRATTIADYVACQNAQRLAWGISDDSYLVPIATMVGAQLHGGLVLGAFTSSGEARGLSFAFLGKIENKLCLYSQLTGVVPGQQGKGIGSRLKFAQRDFARAEGLDCLAWAFDPLQAGNARFNLGRLGATASRLVKNMYGRRSDALNANASTDRLIAEWSTGSSDRPPEGINANEFPQLLEIGQGPRMVLDPTRTDAGLLLEIPENVVRLRVEQPELAEAWSRAVCLGFQTSFAAGYRAEGFIEDEANRAFYVLRR